MANAPVDIQQQQKKRFSATSPWSHNLIPRWPMAAGPLSDIRELTESSLADVLPRKPPNEGAISHETSLSRKESATRKGSLTTKYYEDDVRGRRSALDSPDASSIYSIPDGHIPMRTSSAPARNRSASCQRQPIKPSAFPGPPPPPRGLGYSIPNRGRLISPVKDAAARYEPISFDSPPDLPTRTFLKVPPSQELIEFPVHKHPRISADIRLAAPLFVGGGTIEGDIRVVVDGAERTRQKQGLAIGRISVDLLGVEEVHGAKKHVFLNLATELLNKDHPPPHAMVDVLKLRSRVDPFWNLVPSNCTLPFALSLPLDTGPPPFHSKYARIRYVICVTLLIRDNGKQLFVRASTDTSVLPVYDPEKVLKSLPNPLTVSDERIRAKDHTLEVIHVTAGLHRQVWVSGTSIFVDIHISNNSKKTVKKLELQLERDVLCYKHAVASTLEALDSEVRIFHSNERAILNKSVVKHGHKGWTGVGPHSTEIRTCALDLPRGHATVKCGKYFEVRYFLNVIVSTAHTKVVTVQLPIVLIHINSLDTPPNAVAQVAAAIEEKRLGAAPQDGRQSQLRGQPEFQGDRLPTSRNRSHSRSATHPPPVRFGHHHGPDVPNPRSEDAYDSIHRSRRLHLSRRSSEINLAGALTSARSNSLRQKSDHNVCPPLQRWCPGSEVRSLQGRAFAAPRAQSLEQFRQENEDIQALATAVERSPRKATRRRTDSAGNVPYTVRRVRSATDGWIKSPPQPRPAQPTTPVFTFADDGRKRHRNYSVHKRVGSTFSIDGVQFEGRRSHEVEHGYQRADFAKPEPKSDLNRAQGDGNADTDADDDSDNDSDNDADNDSDDANEHDIDPEEQCPERCGPDIQSHDSVRKPRVSPLQEHPSSPQPVQSGPYPDWPVPPPTKSSPPPPPPPPPPVSATVFRSSSIRAASRPPTTTADVRRVHVFGGTGDRGALAGRKSSLERWRDKGAGVAGSLGLRGRSASSSKGGGWL